MDSLHTIISGHLAIEDLDKDLLAVADAVNQRKIAVTVLIGDLKDYLVSSDQEKRAKGMKVLSSILSHLHQDLLNKDEVKCLVDFFNNRLKDQIYVIENSINGLDSLCHYTNFNFTLASSLFLTLQNDVAIQMFKPEQKCHLYQIVQYLYQRFREDFVKFGSNFVYGFLRIVDAETSPTCLVVIFSMFYEIAKYKEFELFSEDIFESMACYFPIIYSKSKNDKYYETKVELSNLLNRAMSATPAFAEFVMQIVLEKLESESVESKISCYRLLEMALPTYTANEVKGSVQELWITIRIDTLKPKLEHNQLATHALRTLTLLSDVIASDSALSETLQEKIWRDLEISMKTPELDLTLSSVQIFLSFCSSNHHTYWWFFERAQPILIRDFVFIPNSEHQQLCLDAFLSMLNYAHKINFVIPSDNVSSFFTLFLENSTNRSFSQQNLIILILNELVLITDFTKDQLLLLFHYMICCVENSDFNVDIQNSSHQLIMNISTRYSNHIFEFYLDPLMKELNTNPEYVHEKRLMFQLAAIRSAAQDITSACKIMAFLVDRFVYYLNDLSKPINLKSSLNILDTFEVMLATLFALKTEYVQQFYQECISKLLNCLTQRLFIEQFSLPSALIQEFALLLSQFYSSDLSEMIEKQVSVQISEIAIKDNPFVLLSDAPSSTLLVESYNLAQAEYVFSLVYSFVYASNCKFIDESTLSSLFKRIKDFPMHNTTNDNVRKLSSLILSQIILKFDNSSSHLSHMLSIFLSDTKKRLELNASMAQRSFAIQSLIWVTKSLFIKQIPCFKLFAESILDLHADQSLANDIRVLVDVTYSNDDFFQTFNSSQSLKSSDKFSIDLHDMITLRYESTQKDIFLYLLLSHLKFMPEHFLATRKTKVLLMIIKGLEVSQYFEINLLCLTFMQDFVVTSRTQVEEHVITIFRSIIRLARESPLLQVRKKALECITLIIDVFGETNLLKLKEEFVQSLKPTLGDHKRLVRVSAVRAFCQLTMIGQPGNRKISN